MSINNNGFAFALKCAAPYLAVIVFWVLLRDAWLAILAYHVQMVLWSWRSIGRTVRGWDARWFAMVALPAVLAASVLYQLLPHITRVEVGEWLSGYGLSGVSFAVMVPYFGIVHPVLEQAHWSRLRERGAVAHVLFAGYHTIVLLSLLEWAWLAASMLVLVAASVAWHRATKRCGGLLVPTCSHVLADLGMIVAAWALM